MLSAIEIANYLECELVGQDITINGVCTLGQPSGGNMLFASNLNENQVALLNEIVDILVLVAEKQEKALFTYIVVPNPRLAFARLLNQFFASKTQQGIASSAIIGKSKLGNNVAIGHNVVIEDGVSIGANTVIEHNVVVYSNVDIGNNCRIKANATIGGKGFGFERDENGIPVEIPHLGGVSIGSKVEVGSNTTVVAGTIEPTVIEDHVKIDDHVHIAHNVFVGARSLITACAEISGSVRIGSDCWISPNVSIRDGLTIGDRAFVGIGAVVTKNVGDDLVVAGHPAKEIRKSSSNQ